MKRLLTLGSIVALGSTLAAYQAPAPTPTAAQLDKVKSVTPKPVTTIINTHSHGDRTGNNDRFGTGYKNERVKAAIQVIYDETK